MAATKESSFAIPDEPKESIQDRLKQLFRGRNLRTVAREWGLPYSTLNNYFTKGAKPGLDVVASICKIENVSIAWLITGKPDIGVDTRADASSENEKKDLRSAWNLAFEFMDKREAESLLRILLTGGVRGIIRLAEKESSIEEIFMHLPVELKARAIELIDAHVEAKKGASEGSELSNMASPASDQKQAS